MDSSMFDDLWKGYVFGLVIAAMLGIAIWEIGKFLIHHIHVFWK